MKNKKIYLLIGQKGSGKTFIGSLMEKEFGIKFLRVEDWVKHIKGTCTVDDKSYVKEVFTIIENGIRESLEYQNEIVFESTGLSKYFDHMLQRLKNDFNVITILIQCNSELCLARIKTRDLASHVNVSDEEINFINEEVRKKKMKTDYEIDNDSKNAEQIKKEVEKIIEDPRNKN